MVGPLVPYSILVKNTFLNRMHDPQPPNIDIVPAVPYPPTIIKSCSHRASPLEQMDQLWFINDTDPLVDATSI